MPVDDHTDPDELRPSGQDEVRQALVQAGLELVASRGLQFSVRDVADRANVNHGLVHRYFGSKSGLVSAVLDEFNANALAGLDADGLPGDALWDDLPSISVILARIALDTESDPFDRHPVFQQWIESLKGDEPGRPCSGEREAKARVAAAASMALGWALFRRMINFGVAASDADTVAMEAMIRERFVEIGGGSLTIESPHHRSASGEGVDARQLG
ncbi:MAG: TetR family transcriptional regulator [Acidimicrobiales bacterium]